VRERKKYYKRENKTCPTPVHFTPLLLDFICISFSVPISINYFLLHKYCDNYYFSLILKPLTYFYIRKTFLPPILCTAFLRVLFTFHNSTAFFPRTLAALQSLLSPYVLIINPSHFPGCTSRTTPAVTNPQQKL
jgi:hypothetical protein